MEVYLRAEDYHQLFGGLLLTVFLNGLANKEFLLKDMPTME